MVELTLTEDHIYLDQDGKAWPGTTSIISATGMSNLYCHDEYAALRGKHAHTACHLWDIGTLCENTVDPVILPYLNSYRKLRASRPEEVFESELLVCSELFHFAGTLDRIMTDGKWFDLWDLKTGAFDVAHELQTAAYALAWQEMSGERIRDRYGIHLKANGSIAKMVKHKRLNSKAVFLAGLTTITWLKNERG
ncbi:MAG: PD-(D/E)XK nuclease family protein [Candidatus Omnitrophica bacterium]|nr:PD-(D/E)XK nuclease family protein [Candidatus Omnitrophota bacterium]MCK4423646.1 PD-(D/E)XK nuclease family protein [Candidatus Omnitrophota bacterium]